MSTAHYAQKDGHSEAMNGILEIFLRMFSNYNRNYSDMLLEPAEISYSSSTNHLSGDNPFNLDLGWNRSHPLDKLSLTKAKYCSVESASEFNKKMLHHSLEQTEKVYLEVCSNLNKKRSEICRPEIFCRGLRIGALQSTPGSIY